MLTEHPTKDAHPEEPVSATRDLLLPSDPTKGPCPERASRGRDLSGLEANAVLLAFRFEAQGKRASPACGRQATAKEGGTDANREVSVPRA
jgi:hypothetical protein